MEETIDYEELVKRKVNKRRKKIRNRIIIVLIIIAALLVCAYFVCRVENIKYTNNTNYTDEEMSQNIFGTTHPNAILYLIFGNKNKSIPFVQKYTVNIEWPNSMNVTIYEKPVIGYISYMGCNMYFDKDGMVVESSTKSYSGVPEIVGLNFNSIVLDSKLDVGNESVFNQLVELTQSFKRYEMGVDRVFFDSSYNVILYIGNVRVNLGDCEEPANKLYQLKQMYDQLADLKGTLYMENFDGSSKSIIFKKD